LFFSINLSIIDNILTVRLEGLFLVRNKVGCSFRFELWTRPLEASHSARLKTPLIIFYWLCLFSPFLWTLMPNHTKLSIQFQLRSCQELCLEIDVGPPFFILLQPLMPRSHQTFRPVPTSKFPRIMFRIRCWPTIFHIITAEDADG
jgi:hypothetical protein